MRIALLLILTCLFPTLAAANPEAISKPIPEITPLTEALGVEDFTHNVIRQYKELLIQSGYHGSLKGNWALTIAVTFFALILSLLARTISASLLKLAQHLFKWLNLPNHRVRIYTRILHVALLTLIGVLTLYAYTFIWNIPANYDPFSHDWFTKLIDIIINVFVIFVIFALIWEILDASLQLIFVRTHRISNSRSKTILPMAKNITFLVFLLMFALILLSEFGINIMPLLAGAGIVGIAIGFGAQTMVKDFLTGFTLILEDVMRVGDVVTIGNITGTIELITMRKVQVRDYAGIVSTIPFSAISIIQNLSKDFSAYEINIGIGYKNDTDHAFSVMNRVVESMQNDPAFSPIMQEGLEVAGVDKFADSSITLKARILTAPGKQQTVGREFNRRIKLAFESENIDMPYPQRVVWTQNDNSKT